MDTVENAPNLEVHPAPEPVVPSKSGFPLWGAAIIAICIGGGVLLTWRAFQQNEGFPTFPTSTPTAIPTPTPIRTLSALASQSAFLSLSTGVASLSSQLRNFVTEDPSLSPPVLDLPLGF